METNIPDIHKRSANDALVSIVIPAFNEIECLSELCKKLKEVGERIGCLFEVIFVDDGSSDGTYDFIKYKHEEDSRFHFVSFSRNFGHQQAVIAGIEHAQGDAVIMMDADMQHPPDMLPQMIDLWRQGFDVVYTYKNDATSFSLYRRWAMKLGYAIIRRLTELDLKCGQSDFRLIDRKIANLFCAIKERNKYPRGIFEWMGFKQCALSYDVQKRYAGASKYTFKQLLRLFTQGVIGFSILPLRLFVVTGIALAFFSFLYSCLIIALKLYSVLSDAPLVEAGWTTIVAGIFFLGGIQLLGIGILGEYIGNIYDEVKRRPSYIVNESSLKKRSA